MTPEVEAFLRRRMQEVYEAGRRGLNREQTIELAVIVTGALFDQRAHPTQQEGAAHDR
jgi:hypothetical protein